MAITFLLTESLKKSQNFSSKDSDSIRLWGPRLRSKLCILVRAANGSNIYCGLFLEHRNTRSARNTNQPSPLFPIDKTQNTKRLRGNKAPQRRKNQRSQESIDIFLDPVTYLTQLMQLRKEAIPVFTLINEVGTKNERKFKIQVRCNHIRTTHVNLQPKLSILGTNEESILQEIKML